MDWNAANGSSGPEHMLRAACIAFSLLLMALPNTPAQAGGLTNARSSQDMEVGRYWLERHNYLAAMNRFKGLISNYPDSPHTEEALAHLVEAYLALGILLEAKAACVVLQRRFPGGKWLAKALAGLKALGLTPDEDKNLRIDPPSLGRKTLA
jgi:outer membrane protein assembly factor BamD (BamD/ComL family)